MGIVFQPAAIPRVNAEGVIVSYEPGMSANGMGLGYSCDSDAQGQVLYILKHLPSGYCFPVACGEHRLEITREEHAQALIKALAQLSIDWTQPVASLKQHQDWSRIESIYCELFQQTASVSSSSVDEKARKNK
jgi:hypothetical protein